MSAPSTGTPTGTPTGRRAGTRVGTRRPGLAELRSFAAVGCCAYLADLALFCWLRGPLDWGPLPAKAVAFPAGCAVAYAGNALVTYRDRTAGGGDPAARLPRPRRYGVFLAVNLAGALVQSLCLAVSHYGLGLTSPGADTVAGSVVGMALATCLRFWGTRTLVFGTTARARTHQQGSGTHRQKIRTHRQAGARGTWTG